MNTITAQVVMLPTNDKTLLKKFYIVDKYQLLFKQNHIIAPYQHLYFTSDEPIQDCDWYIDDCNQIRKSFTSDKEYWKPRTSYKKIIASTDPALGLPAVPTTWIRDEYVASNGSIKEVKLEKVENIMDGVLSVVGKGIRNPPALSEYKLKLTPNKKVVIVDEPKISEKEFDKIMSEPSLGLFEQVHVEEMMLENKKYQELEDAAERYANSEHHIPYEMLNSIDQYDRERVAMIESDIEQSISDFKAGAEWGKEQSITDTIEFTQWLTKYVILRSQDLWWYKGKDYSSIEMFNIWKNKQ
jgi:hypothetical protein